MMETDNWLRCPNCRHKLGMIISQGESLGGTVLQFKCHTCKGIVRYNGIEPVFVAGKLRRKPDAE